MSSGHERDFIVDYVLVFWPHKRDKNSFEFNMVGPFESLEAARKWREENEAEHGPFLRSQIRVMVRPIPPATTPTPSAESADVPRP